MRMGEKDGGIGNNSSPSNHYKQRPRGAMDGSATER